MLFPNAVAMAFELAKYGFVIGFITSAFLNGIPTESPNMPKKD